MWRTGIRMAVWGLVTAVALSLVAVSGGCNQHAQIVEQQTEATTEAEEGDRQDELLPLVEQQPFSADDVRRLHNCAEYPFEPELRGPWASLANQRMTAEAAPRHRTTDHIVTVGSSIELSARMQYDAGPLADDWVRLYLGDCHGWSREGLRKTNSDGEVTFRLDDRLSPGVYAVVFQSVGDATLVRGQLWVLSSSSRIVMMQLEGAAFDDIDDAADPRVVDAAPQLSTFHADQGDLVVYAGLSEAMDRAELAQWRRTLRESGFAVGPVVEPGLTSTMGGDEPVASIREHQWGRANRTIRASTPVEPQIDILYSPDPESAQRIEAAGIEVRDRVYRQRAETEDETAPAGWTPMLEQNRPDDGPS